MSGWISVRDRIPCTTEESQWVLVYADGAVNCMGYSGGRFSDWTYAKAHNIVIDDITHWMPIPEPPK